MLGRAEHRLNLMGGFELVSDGLSVRLPTNGSKLLAMLALNRRPIRRARIAAEFWRDMPDRRAYANLRSTLWRLPESAQEVVVANDVHLALRSGVRIDVEDVYRLIGDIQDAHSIPSRHIDAIDALSRELLPAWDEDWIVFERERLRQLQLRALEHLTRRFIDGGDAMSAVASALAATQYEPLRETSQRLLVEAHLAAGNRSEAIRQFTCYQSLLQAQLGIAPSFDLQTLGG